VLKSTLTWKPGLAVVVCLALLAPPPVAGRDFFLQEGTEIYLRLHISLDTKISQAGDRTVSTVEEPVLLDNIEVIPAGARVLGRVGEVKKPGRFGRGGKLVLTFETIEVPGAGNIQIAGSLVDIYDPDTIEEEDDVLKDMDIGAEGEVKAGGASKVKTISTSLAGGGVGGALAGTGAGAAIGVAAAAAGAFIWFKGKQVELPAGIGLIMRIDRGITLSVPDLPRPEEVAEKD
jgi:hypothetical protein